MVRAALLRLAQRGRQRVVHARDGRVFQLEIKHHVVLARRIRRYLCECGNALAHKFAVEPQPSIDLAQLLQCEFRDLPAAVGGAVDGVVVDGHEIARHA